MTGLYFGSFNPVHIGHLIIAQYMLDETDCSEVWFVVSPQNPFKHEVNMQPQQRLKMVQMAVSGNKKMKACDAEFHLPTPSYTIHTLRYLQKKYPKKDFALIMGADNFSSLKKWKEGNQILKEFPILVYRRPGVRIKFQPEKNGRIRILPSVLLNISSTLVRERIAEKKSVQYLLPEKVWYYIQHKKLYR
jgi:nicotinate-nucleotide adenylyltransferase